MPMKLLSNIQGLLSAYSSSASDSSVLNATNSLMVEESPEVSEQRGINLCLTDDPPFHEYSPDSGQSNRLTSEDHSKATTKRSIWRNFKKTRQHDALIAEDDQVPCSSGLQNHVEEGLDVTGATAADPCANNAQFDDESCEIVGRSDTTGGKFVHFPADEEIVTEWVEPVRPLFVQRNLSNESNHSVNSLNVHEILQSYLNACKKYKTAHSQKIEKQISCFHLAETERQEVLSLRGDKVTQAHMDCLEEIFKRVQFTHLDFEYCFLDDEAVVALCDMLEFYDSAMKLNLSFNQNITFRGWQAVCRMLKKSPCLEQLNLRYTSLNERSVPLLSRTLRCPDLSLTSLHLENCTLSGKSMLLLACAMKSNSSVRDLHLADNNLLPTDAAHLYQIIINNSTLELLDLRNNSVQDAGLAHICDALKNADCQARSKLNTLVLWNNRLSAHGMIHLIRVLLENKTLKTLNMGRNDICGEGVAIIKEALARNSTLLRLGLQATKLNCQGAIAVAESIADNSSLIRVDLRANPEIKSAGLLALHVALRLNQTITSLNLDKSCALAAPTPSTLSKPLQQNHAEHFRKLFDEIAAFCRRNYDAYVKRLTSQRSDSVDIDVDEKIDGDKQMAGVNVGGGVDFQKCVEEGIRAVVETGASVGDRQLTDDCKVDEDDDVVGKNFDTGIKRHDGKIDEVTPFVKRLLVDDMTTDDGAVILEPPADDELQVCENPTNAKETITANVEYFYDYNNPSKKCVRKVSLTCQELVDNLRERFAAMPRFTEMPDELDSDSPQIEPINARPLTNQNSPLLIESRPQSTPPIAIGLQKSPDHTLHRSVSLSLPLIGPSTSHTPAARRHTSSRFCVSKVVKPVTANDAQEPCKWVGSTDDGGQGCRKTVEGAVRRMSVDEAIKQAECNNRPIKMQCLVEGVEPSGSSSGKEEKLTPVGRLMAREHLTMEAGLSSSLPIRMRQSLNESASSVGLFANFEIEGQSESHELELSKNTMTSQLACVAVKNRDAEIFTQSHGAKVIENADFLEQSHSKLNTQHFELPVWHNIRPPNDLPCCGMSGQELVQSCGKIGCALRSRKNDVKGHESASDIQKGVKGALRDILNYCHYATPNASSDSLSSSKCLLTPVEPPAPSSDDTEVVEALLHDLVCYVDYETTDRPSCQRKPEVIAVTASASKCVARKSSNMQRTSLDEKFNDDKNLEINLAVRRTVRALVKKVCSSDEKTMDCDFRATPGKISALSKFSTCRSSVALRKKALHKR